MTTETPVKPEHLVQARDRVTIRFAGDSGDGMQLTGTQFTRTSAVFGNDIATLPDFPAEIRDRSPASLASSSPSRAPTSAPRAISPMPSSR